MAQEKTSKRGWILAGLLGAVVAAGLFMVIPSASASSGAGDQGPLVLGSNNLGVAGPPVSSSNTANVSSVATDLEASPNYGNYDAAFGAYVFSVDATKSVSGNIDGIHASARGTGVGLKAASQSGVALRGESDSATGTGVVAHSTSGVALSVQGRAAFSRSGKLVITAGHSSIAHTASLGSSALILATIQGNVAGVYVQGVTVVAGTSGSFTIHLNKATPTNVAVAWFVVN